MKLTLIIALTFLLFGCDPGHEITSTVENNSSRQVILIGRIFNEDKVTLNPNESKVITQSGLGGYKRVKADEFCPCGDPDIQIYTVDTSLKITKDIKNSDNWEKTSKRKYIKGGVFTCKYTLTDQDIK